MATYDDLTFRVRNGLINAGCTFKTKEQIKRWVIEYGPNNLLGVRNFGKSSFAELFGWLDDEADQSETPATIEEEIKYHEDRIKYHKKMIQIHEMWFTHLALNERG